MADQPAVSARDRWRRALAVYGDRRLLCILFIGFSSGLPLALTAGTLSLWLTDSGVNKATIGWFALVGIPYAFKFVWAPLIDGLRVPVLARLLGRRRGWAVASQIALMAAIGAMAFLDPAREPWTVAGFAVLVAFLSATQDIVLDAYRVELLDENTQAAGAAVVQYGYRIGMLTSGAGALYIAHFHGWTLSYIVMASIMAVGVVTILINREPRASAVVEAKRAESGESGVVAWTRAHVVMPFVDFLKRADWALILAFILFYKFGDAFAGVMSGKFYRDVGFTLAEIANITKIFGLLATLAGVAIGGLMVPRYGMWRSLMICGVLQMLSNLMFALQAVVGHDPAMLAATIAIENLTGGMGAAAFVAYISSLCTFAFTATQYALFSSLAVVGRTLLSSPAGELAERVDWVTFFVLSAVAAMPGLLLLWLMMRRGAGPEARPAA